MHAGGGDGGHVSHTLKFGRKSRHSSYSLDIFGCIENLELGLKLRTNKLHAIHNLKARIGGGVKPPIRLSLLERIGS